ncbi:MAG: hypothetical protein P1Q69_18705, partial [Candidatus Thorarchaeota archaeon]|nr:hypothetical protein [Candidatus Thorarchaeota archaeon]
MTENIQRQLWKQKRVKTQKQDKMVDKYINSSKSYLVESFVLNSVDRIISKKRKGRNPDPSYSSSQTSQQQVLKEVTKGSGRKVTEIDLLTIGIIFERYTQTVNLLLSRMYERSPRAQSLGQKLSTYKGRAYTLLRKEKDLNYRHNQEIKDLVFERLYRNALEHAGRTLLADWTRRELFTSAIEVLSVASDDVLTLLRRKRISSELVRRVRDACESTKNNGTGFHYTLGVLRQLRLALDKCIMDENKVTITWRGRQRKYVASLLKDTSPEKQRILDFMTKKVTEWNDNGYPFTIPYLKSHS